MELQPIGNYSKLRNKFIRKIYNLEDATNGS